MSHETNLQYRERFRKEEIPGWYSGPLHVFFNAATLIGLCLYCAFRMQDLTLAEWLVFPLTMLIGTLSVYLIHRFPLHHNYWFFPYAYKVHTKMHHQFYTYDDIVYDNPRDFYILFFPIEVVLGHALIYSPLAFFLVAWVATANAGYMFVLGSAVYFMLYEILHYISHLPDNHPILKIGYFNFMREHHRLHHDPKIMNIKNFDIVLPLFDWITGTMTKERPK